MLEQLGVPVEASHAGSSHRRGVELGKLAVPTDLDYSRLLVLLRDPRDTIVSGFHTAKKRAKDVYLGALSEFIRDPSHGIEKVIAFNLMWSEFASSGEDASLLTYEELREDTELMLSHVLAFFGARPWPIRVRFTVWRNSFERMQSRERRGKLGVNGKPFSIRDANDTDGLKVRRGKIGGYFDELDGDDIAFCDEMLNRSNYFETIASRLASSGLSNLAKRQP
jgi:hypothetical protein